ncbi:MAG: heparinase II/III family protein [Planctomycetes bacterium]|nr:heparinase II/III family protein [Planctomycetota bacterium]
MRRLVVFVLLLCAASLPLLAQKKPASKPPQPVTLDKLAIPRDHPRILMTQADLPALREKITREPWSTHWQGVIARSVGGGRRGLDPKDPFNQYGQQPRCFMLTETLECSAMHALLSEDKEPAEALSAFLEAYDPEPIEKLLTPTDFMPHGEFLEGFATCYDWAYPVITEGARAKLRAIIERHAGINYSGFIGKKSWEATNEANNHSMAAMGAVGLSGLALWHENPDAPKWAAMARDKLKAYFEQSFDLDGAGYEGNLYGPFGTARILPFQSAIVRYGHEDVLANGKLDAMVDQWIAEIAPGGKQMLPLNDTDGFFPRWPGITYLYDASKHGNGRARWLWEGFQNRFVGSGGHTAPYALLYDDPEIKPVAPKQLVRFTRGRGLLTVRTGWEENDFLASFEAGERRGGCHCQADHGHFLIFARGQWLAADTGYSNKIEPDSPNQTIGHNGVLIDGKGMAISGNGGIVEAEMKQVLTFKSFVCAQADLSKAYGKGGYNAMKQCTRVFLCMTRELEAKAAKDDKGETATSSEGPEGTYIVVIDLFNKDGAKHDFTFLLHGNKESTFEAEKDRAVHKIGEAALDIVPCGFEDDAVKFETVKFPSGSFGEHPLLKATRSGKSYMALTVLAPRAASDEPVKVTKSRRGGKLIVSVERGNRLDEFTLSGTVDKPGPINVLRKLDGKVAEKAEIKLK